MKRLIGTATVVALAVFLPYAASAQAGKAPNSTNQSVQAEVKRALEAGGFKDVKVDPHTFAVQAKDPSGSPVTILINPDTFESAAGPKPQETIDTSSPKSETGGPSQHGDNERATGSLGDLNGRNEPTLTPGQKQAIWDSLSSEKTMRAKRRVGYAPQVGATVPRSVPVQPLPEDITNDVPALAGYHFAVAGNQIVIVSPSSKKILDIFGEQ
jgi:Protein of unknown function (DUF1236)